MVLEEVVSNFPEFETTFNSLITLFKIIGGILGIYVLFWIINVLINSRRIGVLNKILKNLEEINEKLGKSEKIVKKKNKK
ncbi:MAG: hypothetical protein U9Q06_03640 [Nanoarchaeota archaeon]|nr:hypothetical protein [Nanoarchaeota archaeon]